MKGLTFDSFITQESNQAAFDICKRVAALDSKVPQPVLLLGEEGAGKSHLLWSIVNYFRDSNVQVGVALISAKDFPRKVKKLAEDQSKLQGGRHVCLLVDDLHLFDKDAAELEQVVFAVHGHGHCIVFASAAHPNVLPKLSGKFKALLNKGALVGFKALPRGEGAIIPEAALGQIAMLKARVAELEKAKAVEATPAAAPTEELDSLRAQLSEIERERDEARAALERDSDELTKLREEMERAVEMREGALAETESFKGALETLLGRLKEQKATYASRITALEEQAAQLAAIASQLVPPDSGADLGDSAQVAESFQDLETEATQLIADIEDSLDGLDSEEESAGADPEIAAEVGGESRQVLHDIADQLHSLEGAEPEGADSGDADAVEEIDVDVLPPLSEAEEDDPVPSEGSDPDDDAKESV